MNGSVPSWPEVDPAAGGIVLRQFEPEDVHAVVALSLDPYVPHIGTLPACASQGQALDWLKRQRQRYDDGIGFSFAIADRKTDACLGFIGLTIRELDKGRAQAGYGVVPAFRGRGVASDALSALTEFGWAIEPLHRIELLIEPWNKASVRTADRVGYEREGLLRSHQEIAGERRDMLLFAKIRDAADVAADGQDLGASEVS